MFTSQMLKDIFVGVLSMTVQLLQGRVTWRGGRGSPLIATTDEKTRLLIEKLASGQNWTQQSEPIA